MDKACDKSPASFVVNSVNPDAWGLSAANPQPFTPVTGGVSLSQAFWRARGGTGGFVSGDECSIFEEASWNVSYDVTLRMIVKFEFGMAHGLLSEELECCGFRK